MAGRINDDPAPSGQWQADESHSRSIPIPTAGGSRGNTPRSGSVTPSSFGERKPLIIPSSHEQYNRYKYYDRLMRTPSAIASDLPLLPPSEQHPECWDITFQVYDDMLRFLRPQDKDGDKETATNSLSIIFTIWTTMCGSTMLTMPWAFRQAGLVMGLVIFFVMFTLSYYTVYLVVKHGDPFQDFLELSARLLGKWAKHLGFATSVFIIWGAVCGYHVFLNDSLFSVVGHILYPSETDIQPKAVWRKATSAVLIGAVLFIPSCFKSMDLLFKIVSVGPVFVVFNIIFIVVKSVTTLVDDSKHPQPTDNFALYKSSWPKLATTLCLSFFLHNLILGILRNAKPANNNMRDVFFGYVFTALCYLIPGILALFGLRYQDDPKSDFLETFSDNNTAAFVARACILFQMGSVYPLLIFITRQQITLYFRNTRDWPGLGTVVGFGLCLVGVPTLVAALEVEVGLVVSFVGGIGGYVWIYVLPVGVHLKVLHEQGNLSSVTLVVHIMLMLCGVAIIGLLLFESFA
eukprot:TRINITY_DN1918_c0_g1_i1.p1 TRINITY_DN1918_c0_g1~~TRINITY_DN1918_c0_g1_i1.p1  ORF type:complete len:518 (+),score=54.88 TRINITY_DN1918_c0_g1_i1:65-1618(+)